MNSIRVEFVAYDEQFLKLSWIWLNDDEIRMLTQTPRFTEEDQQNWFDGLSKRSDYKVWGVVADSKRIGVVGLKNITKSSAEYWGYIGERAFWRKGIGEQMMLFAESKAKELKLSEISLKVLETNVAAIRLYQKRSFEITDTDSELIFMKKGI